MKKYDVIFAWVIPITIILGLSTGKWIAYSIMNEGFWYHYGKIIGSVSLILGILILIVHAICKTILYIKSNKNENQ